MNRDKEIKSIQWIQTPFAYTTFHKNLSLLQQNILLQVSQYMQQYWDKYWSSELKNSTENPKPMLSAEDLMTMQPVRIKLSDLGVGDSHYSRVEDAIQEILNLKVRVPFEKDGETIQRWYNIFSFGDSPITAKGTTYTNSDGESVHVDRRKGYIDLTIDPHLVNYVFDMSQGYVSHPENIARIGKVENMPQMYYLIKHRMNNWKKSSVKIELIDIRKYLGMIEYAPDGSFLRTKYQKYSQFKSYVIKKAMDEMHKLYLEGKLDKDFDWKEERDNGRKTGDPRAIVFTLKEVSKITENQNPQSDQPKRSWLDVYAEQHGNPTTRIGQEAWDSLCAQIKSDEKRSIFQAVRVEKIDRKSLILYGSKEAVDAFEHCFGTELDSMMRDWVFQSLTSLAQREVKTLKYHVVEA